jgi:hypothetical protein
VDLQPAHARARARGQQLKLVALRNLAGDERPRRHRAEAAHREGAVDGEPRHRVRRARGGVERRRAQRLLQLVNSLPRPRADGDGRRGFEERAGDQLRRLKPDEFEQLFVHRVRLGEHDETRGDAEQAADVEVLARLRHHALVGRDDERDEVESVRAGQHVLDETLVAGHVHEPDAHVAQVKLGEPEVDGDAAPLLFGQAVGVHARERAHQSRLPVVDVAGRADDDGAHKVNRKP